MNEIAKRSKGSSITRVLSILEAVGAAKYPPSPLELSVTLDIPKPSMHRLLQLLEKEGYIKIDIYGGILIGDRVHRLLMNVWENENFKIKRILVLEKLAQHIGETCGIAILQDNQVLYVDRVQTNWPLQVYLPTGSRIPLWCTSSGKLFLSSFSQEKQKIILRNLPLTQFTQNTLTDIAALSENLAQIQSLQMGLDNEEFIAGMVACSVPIRLPNGHNFAVLYTHAPTIRKSLKELMTFEPLLRSTAKELSQIISFSMQHNS